MHSFREEETIIQDPTVVQYARLNLSAVRRGREYNERTMKRTLYQHLPKLATLDLLVEAGSFRAASARAQVTQSALSQTVSTLESIFGYPLLVRESGSVRATDACLSLLEKLRPVLRSLDDITGDVGRPKADLPALASLDLGSYESLAISVLPALTRRLKSAFPKLHLTIKIGRSGELVKLIRKGELCMAITTELDSTDGLSILPLAEDRFGVFVASDHPQVSRGREALKELWLGTLAPGKEGYPRYYARYIRALKLPKAAVVSDSFEALRAMAAEGAIAAVLPMRVANRGGDGALSELKLGASPKAGSHKIVLVSPKNCDQQESDYLAAELRRLFQAGTI